MKRRAPEPVPEERRLTVRAAIREELRSGPATARELSTRLGISEKDVAEHLGHLERSLAREGLELIILPAECTACGFEFKTRRRLTRPGRCPECGSERLSPPAFQLG